MGGHPVKHVTVMEARMQSTVRVTTPSGLRNRQTLFLSLPCAESYDCAFVATVLAIEVETDLTADREIHMGRLSLTGLKQLDTGLDELSYIYLVKRTMFMWFSLVLFFIL
jgi:hypothetical protein